MDVAESTSLALWFRNFSTRSIDSTKGSLGVFIFLLLSLSFGLHLCFDSGGILTHIVHQFLCLAAQLGVAPKLEVQAGGLKVRRSACTDS
jgi:hypothetical protein